MLPRYETLWEAGLVPESPTDRRREETVPGHELRWDHRRIAATAMLADLRRRHPEIRLVVLTVHCGNRVAVSTYRRAGFVPTGELQPGGRAGPQYVMLHASVPDMHSRQATAP